MTKQRTPSPDIDRALQVAANRLSVSLAGEARYGWKRKSAGCRVIGEKDHEYWLRVQYRSLDEEPGKLWHGEIDAAGIAGVKKPELKENVEWKETSARLGWRGDLLTFISAPACSPTPELRQPVNPDPSWFKTLRDSLEHLGEHNTSRINTRQDLITRRIDERFGSGVDTEIERWTTVHGDMHWANLTAPDCWILDWEAWGQGPRGLDAAFLLCFSLLQPPVADSVYDFFRDWLDTPDGIRSQLFAAAELLRMTDLYGDHPDLLSPLSQHAGEILLIAPRN